MRLNKHCTLLLLIAILLIPSQDLLAKKKKQVKEPTDRELWAGVLYRMAAPVLSNVQCLFNLMILFRIFVRKDTLYS